MLVLLLQLGVGLFDERLAEVDLPSHGQLLELGGPGLVKN